MADITLVNLNMLFIRYADNCERELHLPLGCLYLTSVLERAGYQVDFRDYQSCPGDPFDLDSFVDFMADPAPIVGLSCMANLLPFTLLAAQKLRQRYPDVTVVLGGVGAKAVERKILERFGWIDLVAHGEGERAVVPLLQALQNDRDFSRVPGIFYRTGDGQVAVNPPPERIQQLEAIGRPAYHRVDLAAYDAYGMISSRGCPYSCSFCSVAPVWNHRCVLRSTEDVVAEMAELYGSVGVELFLFQDEFFVSSKATVMRFCEGLRKSGLQVYWKAFARIDLADQEMMECMARAGCVEIRFGVESGSEKVLSQVTKGFTPEMAVDVVSRATRIFPRVDTFFIWGFPDESMEDFYQSLFQMISFRLMGARILPSLLCLLPQTRLYNELGPERQARLQFCEQLLPEYVITGHEVCGVGTVSIRDDHRSFFDFVQQHPDLFPGFFLLDVESKIMPKLRILQEHGFYTRPNRELSDLDSCGAHSPRV